MNEELLTPEDQMLLDRLVDGELSESERRELLLRLERSPDGWRRCALAFLEAQTWRGEAKAMVSEPATPWRAAAIAPATTYRGGSTHWNGMRLWLPLATAAGVLLTVGYLNWFGSGWLGPAPGVDPSDPQNLRQLAKQRSPVVEPGPVGEEELRLVLGEGPDGRRQVVEVPLVDAERMQETLFGPLAQQLPPEIVRLLEQSGNQVVRERRLVPIDLQDGRRVVVPMEQLEIRPVRGTQAFQ